MASGRECLTGMDAKCLRAAAQRAGRVFLTKNLLPRPAGSGCGGGAASQCAGGWSGKGVAWGCSVFFPALKGHKRGCVKTKITVGFAGYFPELACRMAAGFCGKRREHGSAVCGRFWKVLPESSGTLDFKAGLCRGLSLLYPSCLLGGRTWKSWFRSVKTMIFAVPTPRAKAM